MTKFQVANLSKEFIIAVPMSGNIDEIKACREEVYKGFLPVEFSLVPSDLTVQIVPEPVHLMVSRFSYLAVVACDIIEYFQRSSIDFSTDIWFDYSGIPLRR